MGDGDEGHGDEGHGDTSSYMGGTSDFDETDDLDETDNDVGGAGGDAFVERVLAGERPVPPRIRIRSHIETVAC